MPDDRPKCKVVRNMHEKHNGLARVAPKGCRIGKRVLTKGGPIRKVDKKGKLKPDKKKYKVAGDSFEVRADMLDGSKEWLVWGTGAMSTSVNQTVGIKLGLIDTDASRAVYVLLSTSLCDVGELPCWATGLTESRGDNPGL